MGEDGKIQRVSDDDIMSPVIEITGTYFRAIFALYALFQNLIFLPSGEYCADIHRLSTGSSSLPRNKARRSFWLSILYEMLSSFFYCIISVPLYMTSCRLPYLIFLLKVVRRSLSLSFSLSLCVCE